MQLPAQTGQALPRGFPIAIHGQVRYASGSRPAENVLVQLETVSGGLIAQTRTDRDGKFEFANISQEMYRVTATAEGFRPSSQTVNLETVAHEYVILSLVPNNLAASAGPVEMGTLPASVPKEAREEYDKGRSAILNGSDPAKGIPHLEKAVRIYPDFLQAQLLLGTTYMDVHEAEKAEAALKRVLKIDPKTPQAYFALGEIYRERKEYPAAEEAIRHGLSLNDSSWQGHLALGRLYWQMGDVPKAGSEVGRTIQLKPDEAEAYLLAGNVFLKASKPTEALRMFNEYLRLDPKGRYAGQTRRLVEQLDKSLANSKH